MLDAGVFKQSQHHPTMLLIFITEAKMLDEKFKQSQTSSNIVQHRPTPPNMFDRPVKTDQICGVQQCLINIFDALMNRTGTLCWFPKTLVFVAR